MIKRCVIAAVVAATAVGCATKEVAVLTDADAERLKLIAALVAEVKRATVWVDEYYALRDDPIALCKATISLTTGVKEERGGEVKIFFLGGEAKESTNKSVSSVLVVRNPRKTSLAVAVRDDAERTGELNTLMKDVGRGGPGFDSISDVCNPETVEQQGKSANSLMFWQRLANTTVSAIDGLVCGNEQADSSPPAELKELATKLGVEGSSSSGGGIELEVGPVAVAYSDGVTTTAASTVEMVFRSATDVAKADDC